MTTNFKLSTIAIVVALSCQASTSFAAEKTEHKNKNAKNQRLKKY